MNRRHSAIADLAVVESYESPILSIPPLSPPPPPLLPMESSAIIDEGQLETMMIIAAPPPGFGDDNDTNMNNLNDRLSMVINDNLGLNANQTQQQQQQQQQLSSAIKSPESEQSSQITSVTNCSELLATTGTTFSSDITGSGSNPPQITTKTTSTKIGNIFAEPSGMDPITYAPGSGRHRHMSAVNPSKTFNINQQQPSTSTAAASIGSGSGQFFHGGYKLDFDDDDDDDDDEDDEVDVEEEEEEVEEKVPAVMEEEDDYDDDEFDDGCAARPVNRIRIPRIRSTFSHLSSTTTPTTSKMANTQPSMITTDQYGRSKLTDLGLAESSSQDEEEKARYELEFETEEEEYGVDDDDDDVDDDYDKKRKDEKTEMETIVAIRPNELDIIDINERKDKDIDHYSHRLPELQPELTSTVNPNATGGSSGRASSKSLPENLFRSVDDDNIAVDDDDVGVVDDDNRRGRGRRTHFECDLNNHRRGRLARTKSSTLGRLPSSFSTSINVQHQHHQQQFGRSTSSSSNNRSSPLNYLLDDINRDLTPVQDSIYSSDLSSANTVIEKQLEEEDEEYEEEEDEEDEIDDVDGNSDVDEIVVPIIGSNPNEKTIRPSSFGEPIWESMIANDGEQQQQQQQQTKPKRDFSSEIFDRLKISPEKYPVPLVCPGPPSLIGSDHSDNNNNNNTKLSSNKRLNRQDTLSDMSTTGMTTTSQTTPTITNEISTPSSRREDIPLLIN